MKLTQNSQFYVVYIISKLVGNFTSIGSRIIEYGWSDMQLKYSFIIIRTWLAQNVIFLESIKTIGWK